VLREQFGFFWLHARLSGDYVRLSLCTEKQLKLDSFLRLTASDSCDHRALLSRFFCPIAEKQCPDNLNRLQAWL
jgi:hypothetical protein